MTQPKRSLLNQIDQASAQAARQIRLALSILHNLRTGTEANAVDKPTTIRLIRGAETALQEVETF